MSGLRMQMSRDLWIVRTLVVAEGLPPSPWIILHPALQSFIESFQHLHFQLGMCVQETVKIIHTKLPDNTGFLHINMSKVLARHPHRSDLLSYGSKQICLCRQIELCTCVNLGFLSDEIQSYESSGGSSFEAVTLKVQTCRICNFTAIPTGNNSTPMTRLCQKRAAFREGQSNGRGKKPELWNHKSDFRILGHCLSIS